MRVGYKWGAGGEWLKNQFVHGADMISRHILVSFVCCLALIPFAAGADDSLLVVSINSLWGSPPASGIIGVTVGSSTNQNPVTISFHVEFSDDLSNWTPLHSAFSYADTNAQPTVATCLTIGQTALFSDVHMNGSAHRFYRAVVDSPQVPSL